MTGDYSFISYELQRLSLITTKMYSVYAADAHAPKHVTRDYGDKYNYMFWNLGPRFAYSLYNFFGAPATIKGRLLSSR